MSKHIGDTHREITFTDTKGNTHTYTNMRESLDTHTEETKDTEKTTIYTKGIYEWIATVTEEEQGDGTRERYEGTYNNNI